MRWKSSIARAYCLPRNTSSASFSRVDAWRQTGMATTSMIDITLSPMRSAIMAYPFWLPRSARR